MLRSLLVPLDGSDLAEQALPLALRIAQHTGASLTILHVVMPPKDPLAVHGMTDMGAEHLKLLLDQAQVYLESVCQRIQTSIATAFQPINVISHITLGQPAIAIAEYARVIQSDLIVMATHGRSGLARWALGSVADKLIQLSPIPLLLIRPQAPTDVSFDTLPRITKIMVTLDGSSLATRALPLATELCRRCDSALLLYSAVLLPPALPILMQTNPDVALAQEELLAHEEHAAHAELQAIAATLPDLNPAIHMSLAADPAAAILAAADEFDPTLIVMTTHGYSGLRRLVYGSVTDRVLHHGHHPVLIVRPTLPVEAPTPPMPVPVHT